MSDVPLNEKLFAMVVGQAKAKYQTYPSPGASAWVHRRYLELGGKFEDSQKVAERKRSVERFKEVKENAARRHVDKNEVKKKVASKKKAKGKK
jgi:hypothetical protein